MLYKKEGENYGSLLAYRVTFNDGTDPYESEDWNKYPVCVYPTGLTATYGQTLTDVTLTNPDGNTPGTWTWVDAANTSVGNVGDHTFKANFTPTDTNYNPVSNVDLTVTVGKANPTADAPAGLTATYGQTLADVTLTNPQGNTAGTWTWVDASATSVGNVGSNTFKANFTPTDIDNYNSKMDVNVSVTVGKANPTAKAPAGLTATYGQTLTDVTLTNPQGNTPGTWTWVDAETSVGNVGTNTFKANFTPTDTNYNSVNNVEVTVVVNKAVSVPAVVTADNRTYDGTEKPLVNVDNSTLVGGKMQYALGTDAATAPDASAFSESIPTAAGAGTYYVWYKVDGGDNYNGTEATSVVVSIDKKDLQTAVNENMVTMRLLPQDEWTYDGQSHEIIGVEISDNSGQEWIEDVDYTLSGVRELHTEVGEYAVTVTAAGMESSASKSVDAFVMKAEGSVGENYSGSVILTWRINDLTRSIDFYRIFSGNNTNMLLPATGFSSLRATMIAEKPLDVNYQPLRMLIQIPVLESVSELVTIPLIGNEWPVTWLGDKAGLLEGSALPGKGISVIAAHNTLNNTEYGSFALLSTLAVNDAVFVSALDGTMQLFRVYANELLLPNDMEKLVSIAEQAENTLVLLTCENESAEGSYINRRAVFAKPVR
jgi:hypothetical protein